MTVSNHQIVWDPCNLKGTFNRHNIRKYASGEDNSYYLPRLCRRQWVVWHSYNQSLSMTDIDDIK